MPTATVSFSLDQQTKDDIELLAKQSRRSRSDVVRDMMVRYRLERKLEEMEAAAAPLLYKLGLKTEDDIAEYAKH